MHCVGHNYIGQTLQPGIKFMDGVKTKFTLHGTGWKKYAVDRVDHLIKKERFDIFGILLDTFMMMEADFLHLDTSPAKTFFYFPSDGGGCLPRGCENILKKVNMPIAMSRFGQRQVKLVYDIDAEFIPHGFDKNIFYKESVEVKAKARAKWLLTNKFVVGAVARNQGRKALDRTLKAFKLFCVDKPDAVLLLHCDPQDVAQSFYLPDLINTLKLNNRVLFTGTTFHNPFTYDQMREVYNLMDVFFLSTTGEGFGVPTIEAMACGVPQVQTDYTTSRELLLDDGLQTGLLVNLVGSDESSPDPHTNQVLDGTITGNWNVERGFMGLNDAKVKLDMLYYDRKLLTVLGVNCVRKAAKLYAWEKIMPRWNEVLEKLQNEF